MAEYLNNEQVEKESWELIHVDVRYINDVSGEITSRFAYKEDIEDTFRIIDGKIKLKRYYPYHTELKIKSCIREKAPNAKPKRQPKEQPTIIRISRPKT